MSEIVIPNDKKTSFKNKLDSEENDSIFLSAKFGKGKTTFLKHFFKSNNEEYLPVFLNPVLYSVHSNEDIFKLLKFDIVHELLKIFEAPESNTIDKSLVYYFAAVNRVEDILGFFFENAEKLNKTLGKNEIKLATGFRKIILQCIQQKAKLKKDIDQFSKGELGALEYQLSILEEGIPNRGDLFSAVCSEILKSDQRQKVLIIDDLDRLDPDHLFRLLNVLSNCFYEDIDGDKVHKRLGFDKIVLVGHYRNIAGCFHHKYGKDVDFIGYFKKFHNEIHSLNYELEVKEYIKLNLKISWKHERYSNLFKLIVTDFLEALFHQELISWRQLEQIKNCPLVDSHWPNLLSQACVPPIFALFYWLKDILDGVDNLIYYFNELERRRIKLSNKLIEDNENKIIVFKNLCVVFMLNDFYYDRVRATNEHGLSLTIKTTNLQSYRLQFVSEGSRNLNYRLALATKWSLTDPKVSVLPTMNESVDFNSLTLLNLTFHHLYQRIPETFNL